MKKMTCIEFDEILWNDGFYSEIHSEMHWGGSYSSEKIFIIFKSEAVKRNVELTDLEEFDYDKTFYNNYKSDSDKGLS